MSVDPAKEIAAADAEILAAMARRVDATLRLRAAAAPVGGPLCDAAVRELLAVVDVLTRREAARAGIRG